jgi:GNAT superfamily N-acetyltransferase
MTDLESPRLTVELAIQLRLATRADLPRLEWFGQYKHYRNVFRRSYREQQLGRRLMIVADCNDFPIGHIFVQLASTETSIADGAVRAYFYSLRVMPMFRGHGIGTRLIAEAENRVRAHGFRWATIAVAKNNVRARQLYERLKYQIFRDDPGHWSYLDHRGEQCHVHEPCWILEKFLTMR